MLAQTQNCTSQNSAPVNKRGWPQGATVPVYIDPQITGQRRDAVVQAFNNWTQSKAANGSNVIFTFVSTAPSQNTGFTVLHQQPASDNRASTDTRIDDADNLTTNATTHLSPTITVPAAVLEAMSHEIGHPSGFADCETCAPSESVMATRDRYANDNDVIGRATSPTLCDNQQLQTINYPIPTCNSSQQASCENYGGFWNPNECVCESHNIGGGGGGGPVNPMYDGYCTPYYWVNYRSYDGGQTWNVINRSYVGCW